MFPKLGQSYLYLTTVLKEAYTSVWLIKKGAFCAEENPGSHRKMLGLSNWA